MKIYLVKKEKNRIYKSEDMVPALTGRNFTHNEKGAPLVEDGYVSVTHTAGYWACALSDRPVGIDMEELSRKLSPAAAKKLHPAEKEYLSVLSEGSAEWREEFLRIWTKKESYLKYLGKGLAGGLSGFCVLEGQECNLETPLFCLVRGPLVFAATEEFEVVTAAYEAPMNKSALEAGADILDMRGYSSRELQKKLEDRGYAASDAEAAVNLLEERGFLNDEEYARSLAEKFARRGYAAARIELELKKKSVPSDIARKYRDAYKETDGLRASAQAAKLPVRDEKEKARAARKLASLGYDVHTVYDLLAGRGSAADEG